MSRHYLHLIFQTHLRFLLVATVLILALFLLLVPSAGADVTITPCGELVAAGETGHLLRPSCAKN